MIVRLWSRSPLHGGRNSEMINPYLSLLLASTLVIAGAPLGAYAQKGQTMKIKVYFHHEKLNPEMMDCTKAFPTIRTIPKTTAPARAALDELFKGVTAEEKAKGFWSFEPENTKNIVKGLRIVKGAAYLNFTSKVLESLGNATTSCGAGFWPMVEKTLMQFPTVKKVFYAVDDDPALFYDWVQVGECPKELKKCDNRYFK